MDVFILLVIALAALTRQTSALIGFECSSPRLNITTINLLEVGSCEVPKPNVKTTKTDIQLLQIKNYDTVPIKQCKIQITRQIFHCGFLSHIGMVSDGFATYIEEVTAEKCESMHTFGLYTYGPSASIQGLRVNATKTQSVIFAGRLDQAGNCQGVSYADPYGSWEDVVVQGTITIPLNEYPARLRIDNNQIQLQSGVTCDYKDQHCMDLEGGNTFWRLISFDSCSTDKYDILYQGPAIRMLDADSRRPVVIYSVETNSRTFSLAIRHSINICGYNIITTEHPKLFITEGRFNPVAKPIGIENLDIFTYVNAKFVYIANHIKEQIKLLYIDILEQRCKMEQDILKNAAAIATDKPDLFAYNLMKGPGYMAVVAGEVVHVVKCIPADVKMRQEDSCYQQLPVSRNKESWFLSPKTHILMKSGTEVNCNPFTAPMYLIDNVWYKFLPKPTESMPPRILSPQSGPTWKYISPSKLATSGIYTTEELDSLRELIMFPAEKEAVLNSIARSAKGMDNHQGLSIGGLLDEETLKKIAHSTWNRMWDNFVNFGTISAGIFGVLLALKILKLVIDTIIHGYTLHAIYGMSIHLIGALWSSVTHLLIHLDEKEQKEAATKEETNQLMDVQVIENSKPTGSVEPQDKPSSSRQNPEVYPSEDLRREARWITNMAEANHYYRKDND